VLETEDVAQDSQTGPVTQGAFVLYSIANISVSSGMCIQYHSMFSHSLWFNFL